MKRSVFVFLPLFIIVIPLSAYQNGGDGIVSAAGTENNLLYFPMIQTPFVPHAAPYAGGIPYPSDVTNIVDPGDGRLFVTTKDGRIYIVDAGGQIQPQMLLDIRDKVYSSRFELGLLGLAVHPDFETNGYIYLYYTHKIDETLYSEVARFTVANNGFADPQSEQSLLRILEPQNVHQAGALQFGPEDGYLYIATGDGGTLHDEEGLSQSLESLHGKILRIDVDSESPYAIPADNPFVSNPANRGEIWAYGLRNPWRFSIDRETGDMFIADVGEHKWEEINFIPVGSGGGQNFGWPCLEGDDIFVQEVCDFSKNYVQPIFTYTHNQDVQHCTVIGGYVYRGAQLPELWGSYLFADLCGQTLWALAPTADLSWQSTRWTHFSEKWSTFGERSDGELFMGDISSDKIFQIARTPAGN
ncbi:MAG: PQQ-dependent sugar dehydrogenase [Candidatus Promineifilaceae bacterium]|nr:PQQ-dependent sugar dehydrogenase [Candidatus Promineifilaceae bacterium]